MRFSLLSTKRNAFSGGARNLRTPSPPELVSSGHSNALRAKALTQIPHHQPGQMPQETRSGNQRRDGKQDPDRRRPRGNAVRANLERGVGAVRLHRLYPEQEEDPYAVPLSQQSSLHPRLRDIPRPHNGRIPPQQVFFNEKIDERRQRRKCYPSSAHPQHRRKRETHAQRTAPTPSMSRTPSRTSPAMV